MAVLIFPRRQIFNVLIERLVAKRREVRSNCGAFTFSSAKARCPCRCGVQPSFFHLSVSYLARAAFAGSLAFGRFERKVSGIWRRADDVTSLLFIGASSHSSKIGGEMSAAPPVGRSVSKAARRHLSCAPVDRHRDAIGGAHADAGDAHCAHQLSDDDGEIIHVGGAERRGGDVLAGLRAQHGQARRGRGGGSSANRSKRALASEAFLPHHTETNYSRRLIGVLTFDREKDTSHLQPAGAPTRSCNRLAVAEIKFRNDRRLFPRKTTPKRPVRSHRGLAQACIFVSGGETDRCRAAIDQCRAQGPKHDDSQHSAKGKLMAFRTQAELA